MYIQVSTWYNRHMPESFGSVWADAQTPYVLLQIQQTLGITSPDRLILLI